ncbi:MAG: PQQ-binding-like beta-propeller repeat protein [Planctomycetaceae bacterium]
MTPSIAALLHTARPLVVGLAATLFVDAAAAVAGCAGCPAGTLADEFRAADARLVRVWIVQVPFDSAAWKLGRVVVADGLVLAQSGDGGVHAIRASGTDGPAAGTMAWSRAMPAAAGHAWPPTVGARLVYVTSGKDVLALDRATGSVEWERSAGGLTAAAAAESGRWVYVPLETGRLLRLPVDPFGRAGADRADAPPPAADARDRSASPPESLDPVIVDAGGRLDRSPAPIDGGVIWGTESGLVALQPTSSRWIRHRFPDTTATRQPPMTLVGSPVVRRDEIFVVTADGMLARIALNAPQHRGLWAAWSRSLPDRPDSGPIVSGDTVLDSLAPAGIAAFEVSHGVERWWSCLDGTIVAVAGGRAWVLDDAGRLTELDLATGAPRGSWPVGCFTLPVVNAVSERIVLASPSGLVVSLAPPTPAATAPVTAADAPEAEVGPEDPGPTPP